MLDFEPKNRPDFETIEDILIFSLHCPFKFFTPIVDYNEEYYLNLPISGEAFQEFLLTSRPEVNEMCFREELYYCFEISLNFTKIVVEAGSFNFKLNYSNVHSSLKKKFIIDTKEFNKCENVIKTKNKIKNLDVFEKLIFLYTFESDFYKTMNKSLAANNFEDFSSYIQSIINLSQAEKYQKYKIHNTNTVFRSCQIEKSNELDNKYNLSIRSGYFTNISYFWPGFTSTSKNFDRVLNFIDREELNRKDIIIFLIKLNLNNKKNKLDISSLNPYREGEEEVLLFPYFGFCVKDVKPISYKFHDNTVMHYKLIEVEELPEGKLPVRPIWFDPLINTEENLTYQQILRDVYHFNQANFFNKIDETINFIEKAERNVAFFVISCGSQGKDLIEKIKDKENVSKIALFCLFKKKHEKWFTKKKYKKFLGIFTEFKEIQMILTKINY